ncbi:response regulator transcription factor [Arthrobacter sp. VKM Ac-2550]|uniref:response regulator transcription factor n=1 Tax=Crystallibacter permensis TaxID=1938888 RepID=UPI0022277768|nr:response regulator transcription factor [Arthrobacter sp. VKM Ac-2550]MCW2134411.1 two-component system, OmpR family, response regulator [Arthrobacter sp. VKM Ac-2550]
MAAQDPTELVSGLPKLRHPDGSPVRALVVDDEPQLSDLVRMGLRMAGWDVHVAHDGPSAVKIARDIRPDVLVLDVMMPGFDGVEALGRIRSFSPNVPALFLTAKDAVADRITGLAAGGDDYVTKPFSMEEVMLRLHRLVQRSGVAAAAAAELVVGDLVLNLDTREVTRAGTDFQLTATEFDLLHYLMDNARTVVSKSQILDHVWNYDFGGQNNIVELYISYLRKKIDAGRSPMIHTVRGVGYVLKPAV